MNFTHLFLFLFYDVYVTSVSLLITESHVCVLKSFTTLPEVEQQFKKVAPQNRRLTHTDMLLSFQIFLISTDKLLYFVTLSASF
jgi:hypothetical protein